MLFAINLNLHISQRVTFILSFVIGQLSHQVYNFIKYVIVHILFLTL